MSAGNCPMFEVDEKAGVLFYSGHKEAETPRAIVMGGQEHPIEEVLERKRIQDRNSGKTFDLFICRIAGKRVKIKRDESGHCEISPPGALAFLR